MIRHSFLDPKARKDLTELARDGSTAHRLARRASAMVLLDDGMSYAAVAKVTGQTRMLEAATVDAISTILLLTAIEAMGLVKSPIPIERLWGLMHSHITRNRYYERFADFRDAMLTFLREEVQRFWYAY